MVAIIKIKCLLLVIILAAACGLAEQPPVKGNGAGKTGKRMAPAGVDLYGDPLPEGAVARMGTLRFAHGDDLARSPALAADHRTFATVSNFGGQGRMICLWDANTGKQLRQIRDADFDYFDAFFLKKTGLLGTIGFSHTAVEGEGNTYALHFWDPKTGKKAPLQIQAPGYHFEPWALAPDEKWLACASSEVPVLVRDLKTGKPVAAWEGKEESVNCLAFSQDGKTIVIGCNSAIHLWEWTANRDKQALEWANTEQLWYSPDGKWLAAASGVGICVWETSSWKAVWRYKDPRGAQLYPQDFRFLPAAEGVGGKMVSTVTGAIWDLHSAKECGKFENFVPCRTLEFSQDGKTATGFANGRIRRWHVATGKDRTPPSLPVHDQMIHQLGFLPDGKTVVSSSPNGAVLLWDAVTGKQRQTLVPGTVLDDKQPVFMRVAPDGTIAVVRNNRLTLFKDEEIQHQVELTDFDSETILSINLSPDGKTMAVAGGNAEKSLLQLWDLSKLELLSSFKPPQMAGLVTLGISPTRRKIVMAIGDSVCLLNAQTGAVEQSLDKDPEVPLEEAGQERVDFIQAFQWFPGIQAMGFSPDGALVVSSGYPAGGLKILDVAAGKPCRFLGPQGQSYRYSLHNAIFSPDGTMVAAESDDNAVEVWEISSGKLRRRFLGHRSYQTTLAFSPDGTKLASGNRDTTILVWDIFGLSTGDSPSAQAPTHSELAGWWDTLKDQDAERACLAMGRFIRFPDASVPFLKERLEDRRKAEVAQLKQWLTDLDNPAFATRQKATESLTQQLAAAQPLLKDALTRKPPLEMVQRIKALLRKAELDPYSQVNLRDLRALEVLEHIGSKAAGDVVQALATGNQDAWLAGAANAVLKRLTTKVP